MEQNVRTNTPTIEEAAADYLRVKDGFNDYMRSKYMNLTEWDIFYKDVAKQVGISIEVHSDDKVRYRQRTVSGAPGIWISKEEAHKILDEALEMRRSPATPKNFTPLMSPTKDVGLEGITKQIIDYKPREMDTYFL